MATAEETTRTLADHGARIDALEKGLTAIFAKLDLMATSLATLLAQSAAAHTPETCHRMTDIVRRVELLEADQRRDEREHATHEEVRELAAVVARHETTIQTTSGAGKGLHLALGVVATVIAIIGALVAWLKP